MSNNLKILSVVCLMALSACAASGPGEVTDPYEQRNREVHRGNKHLDTTIVRPVSQAYGNSVPAPVRKGVSNFAGNLSMPSMVVNDVLQVRLGDAISNTARFVVNSTVGIAGLFDPASAIGLTERDTDFGETLHVWGFREGAYLELPVLGPSTERDAIGTVVDVILDPVGHVVPEGIRNTRTTAAVAARIGDRHQYSDTVDSILYDSADSYSQARLLYLQNRRFELGADQDQQYIDPYEDPYDQ